VFVADPSVADADPLGPHVDVLPMEPEKFGLAQPARRRSEDDEPEYRADRVAVDRAIGYRCDHSIQRRQRQELQVGIRVAFPSPPRSRGSSHRVGDHPIALLGERKHGVQERHDIPHCLSAQVRA
jgi:hypothetical protein